MIRRLLWISLVVAVAGCTTQVERAVVADNSDAIRRTPAFMTHVQVQATPLGEVPNSGVQLPVVSPDGQWIACLEVTGGPVDGRAPISGEGLERLSLSIQRVEADAVRRVLCPRGAAWPSFSADSRHLAWIIYDGARCDIARYDLQTGTIRRISPGLKHMMMASLSPTGDRVAVVAQGPDPDGRRIHVVDMETSGTLDCPTDSAASRQYLPQWTADGRIVYVLVETDATYAAQWGPGRFDPEKLAAIPMRGSDDAAYLATAGVASPLSADGRRLAFFDANTAAMTLVGLQSGQSRRLPESFASGCWFDGRRFIAAGSERMSLFGDPDKPAALLMRGPWLPRRATDGTVIALTRGSHQRAFALVRLKVTPGE